MLRRSRRLQASGSGGHIRTKSLRREPGQGIEQPIHLVLVHQLITELPLVLLLLDGDRLSLGRRHDELLRIPAGPSKDLLAPQRDPAITGQVVQHGNRGLQHRRLPLALPGHQFPRHLNLLPLQLDNQHWLLRAGLSM